LCHYYFGGREVFATVDNDEKRAAFLMENFGISSSRIFNSSSTAFASELMLLTNGYDIDVILNSLMRIFLMRLDALLLPVEI
jgi:hypothetical protein